MFWNFFYTINIIKLLLFSVYDTESMNDETWKIQINKKNGQFIDGFKRTRIFHGVNVVWKRPFNMTLEKLFTFGDKEMNELNELGLNIVRLGIIWHGIMPNNRSINHTYLEKLKKVVDTGKKHGIYFLLDMHQDIMSEAFCGDGAPIWPFLSQSYFYTFPYPLKFSPFTRSEDYTISKAQCEELSWSTYYFSEAVSKSFEDLYTNAPPMHLLDIFSEAWTAVVQTFINCTNVIGYDILNEPFAGNLFKNPLIMIPSIANRRIEEFHNKLHNHIRKIDNEKILFLEGVTWTYGRTGFRNWTGPEYSNRTAVNFHYYRPPNISPHVSIEQAMEEAKHFKIGLILSEFFTTGESVKISEESYKTMDLADKYKISWIGWQYFEDPYTSFNSDYFDMTYKNSSRIYPIAVAGELESYFYDMHTISFQMKYSIINNISYNVTEIYYPQSNQKNIIPKIDVVSSCATSVHFFTANRIHLIHGSCIVNDLIHVSISF